MVNLDTRLINKLTGDELSVFCHIIKRIGKNNKCFPSRDLLSKETGYGKRRLSEAIKGLIDKSIISKHQVNIDGNFGKTIYKITTDLAGVFITVNNEEIQESDRDAQNRPTVLPLSHNETLSINHNISINHSKEESEKLFLKDWGRARAYFKISEETNIPRLSFNEKKLLHQSIKDFGYENIKLAMNGLFKQKVINFSSMTLKPTHFLERVDVYLNAAKEKNYTLYGSGKDKKEVRL